MTIHSQRLYIPLCAILCIYSMTLVYAAPVAQAITKTDVTNTAELDSGSNLFNELDSGSDSTVSELDSGPGKSTPSNTKDSIGLKNPLKVDTIGGLVQTAVEIFSYVVIIFAVLAFIWVGLQYILARGNAERMKELSKWLGYIVIGVAVIIGARVIISIVISTLSSTGVVDQRVIQSAENALKGN